VSVNDEPLWQTHEFRSCVEGARRYVDYDTDDLLRRAQAVEAGHGSVVVEARELLQLIWAYQKTRRTRETLAGMGERVAEELFLLKERWTRHVILGRCVCHDGPGACKGPDPD
jgi:hypothetical protein